MGTNNSDFLNYIRLRYDKLSKGHKKIADFIFEDYSRAAHLTAAKLGEACGVSESSVVRFAGSLGLSGFPELSEKLATLVEEKLSNISVVDYEKEDDILRKVHLSDVNSIEYTFSNISTDVVETALELIEKAKTVYIVGLMDSTVLAGYLYNSIKDVVSDVRVIVPDSYNNVIESIYRIDKRDVFIGIGFSPYSLSLIKAMEYANSRKVPIVTITDDKNSPMTLYSSCNFYTPVKYLGTVKSLVAPMSLVNMLVAKLCVRNKATVIKNIKHLKEAKLDYQVIGEESIDSKEDIIMQDIYKMSDVEGK